MTALTDYIDEQLRAAYARKWADEADMILHEAFWGVPCGPTLSMVNPPQLRGIARVEN